MWTRIAFTLVTTWSAAAAANPCDQDLIERALATLETLPALERLELYDEHGAMRTEVEKAASALYGFGLNSERVVHRPKYAAYLERIAARSIPSEHNYSKRPIESHHVAITRLRSSHGVTAAFVINERFPKFAYGVGPARERWRVIPRSLAAREWVRDDLLRMFVSVPEEPSDLSDLITFADGLLKPSAGGPGGFARVESDLVLSVIGDLVHLEPLLTVRRDLTGQVVVIARDLENVTGRTVRTFDQAAPELRAELAREFERVLPTLLEKGIARVISSEKARQVLIDQEAPDAYSINVLRDPFTEAWAARLGQMNEATEISIQLNTTDDTARAFLLDLMWTATNVALPPTED